MNEMIYTRPKDFTRAERAFIDALYNLVQTKDFEEIHITDILRLSGYSKGAFYGRFEDKYDFVKKILLRAGDTHSWFLYQRMLIDDSSKDAKKEIHDITLRLMQYVYQHRNLYSMLIDRKLGSGSYETFFLEFNSPLNRLVREKEASGISYDVFTSYFGLNASMIYVMFWKYIDFKLSPEEITVLVQRFEGDFRECFRLDQANEKMPESSKVAQK